MNNTKNPNRAHVAFVLAGLCALFLYAIAASMPVTGQATIAIPGSPGHSGQPDQLRKSDLPRSSRIPWLDDEYFLAGVNYPLYVYYGGDIGTLSSVNNECNWQYTNSFNYAAIDADFTEMQENGVHVVRWFLFGDGRGAPEFDNMRLVTGFDSDFYSHMDQAMEIAARHNIYIVWTLWDFLMFKPARWLCGAGLADAYAAADKMPPYMREQYLAHLKTALAAPASMLPGSGSGPGSSPSASDQCMLYGGGHRNLVTDISEDGAQDTFFDNALIPMLERYAGNLNIIGWEIMNEPEWALNYNDYTPQRPIMEEPVDVDDMSRFFRRFTDTVHEYAPNHYATVGGASLKFFGFGSGNAVGLWQGLGFDYYGAHYYGWMDNPNNNGSPLDIDYDTTATKLDAPVVIGELPANGGTAPVYLPSVRREAEGEETSTLSLNYICTSYAPLGEADCTRPYTATIDYFNTDGSQAMSQEVVLAPYSAWTGEVPPGAGTFSGSARILSNGPVGAVVTQTGMLLGGQDRVAYNGQDAGNLTTWLPLVTNQDTHRSRIAVQNTWVHTAEAVVTYFNADGTVAGADMVTLAPLGSVLIDPLLPGSPQGPPSGFQGSAVITGTWPLVATVYELDLEMGSDAYNGEGQSYRNDIYIPSVRNWSADGTPSLYVQNPCCHPAQLTVTYFNVQGTSVASQSLSLPLYGSALLDPQAVLPGGFEGSAIITSTEHPAAVMRTLATGGSGGRSELYAGTEYSGERFHFPLVRTPSEEGVGPNTVFSVQNVNPSAPITVWVTLHDMAGTTVYETHDLIIPPNGSWTSSASDLPGVPDGFLGSAEVLWPWPYGWSAGFAMLAVARDPDPAAGESSAHRGFASHTLRWAVTPYSPRELLDGIYDKGWAGALSWSFYDHGTGSWNDFRGAMSSFDSAHPEDLGIGETLYTPVPTPGNTATATAAAATPTTSYGNPETATAVAQLTGTPGNCITPTVPPSSSPTITAIITATSSATTTASPSPTQSATLPPPSPTACTLSFTDVEEGSTFHPYIMCMACRGIVSGYTVNCDTGSPCFKPGNLVTRGQLAKIVANSAGFQEPTGTQQFEDVQVGSTFFEFVWRLADREIVSGYPCGGIGEPCGTVGLPYYRPNNNVTRGQISKIVSEAAGLSQTPSGQQFEDVAEGSTFYEWIWRLVDEGVMNGYPCGGSGEPCGAGSLPYFRPGASATRGQASKIVANTFFPHCQVP